MAEHNPGNQHDDAGNYTRQNSNNAIQESVKGPPGDTESLPPEYIERYISLQMNPSNPQPDTVAEESFGVKPSKTKKCVIFIVVVVVCIIGGAIGAGAYFALKKMANPVKIISANIVTTTPTNRHITTANGTIIHKVVVQHCFGRSTSRLYGLSGQLEVTSYSHNAECTWYINVPEDKIALFTVERVNNANDRLYLTTPGSMSLKFYSGQSTPEEKVTFGGNNIIVQLKADEDNKETGFKGHWTAENYEDILCKGRKNITGTSGVIATNQGATFYANNMFCEWLVTVPENHTISLEVLSVRLANDDSLVIWDTASPDTEPVFKSKGNRLSTLSLVGIGRRFFITFSSNDGNMGHGFKANYTAIPVQRSS